MYSLRGGEYAQSGPPSSSLLDQQRGAYTSSSLLHIYQLYVRKGGQKAQGRPLLDINVKT